MPFRPTPLRFTLALAAGLLLSACDRAPETQAPAAPASGATPSATAPVADLANAPAPVRTPGPIVPPQGPEPVRGKDFEEIPNGQPFEPAPGKIEVVEVFGYVCPACAAFAPVVGPWERTLPADVVFRYVPAPFGPEWDPYAKSLFAAEQLGLRERAHDALIDAIHVSQSMPGEGDKPDEQAIANFYARYGADPKQFLEIMNSFAIATKVNQGKQFMQRTGVTGTPTLVINGKYRVTGGESFQDRLRIAEHLIARERAALGGAGAPAAPAAPAPATTPAPAPAAAPATGG
ncbi:thiol:disulfide interchange protein DsbA/DsbL [Lysobacter humi (ex Lee et al. 2017)]